MSDETSDAAPAEPTPKPAVKLCETCGQPLGRKHWFKSYKVRCAWIASSFSIAAAAVYLWTGLEIPTALVASAQLPFLLLGGGETWHDGIKLKASDLKDLMKDEKFRSALLEAVKSAMPKAA